MALPVYSLPLPGPGSRLAPSVPSAPADAGGSRAALACDFLFTGISWLTPRRFHSRAALLPGIHVSAEVSEPRRGNSRDA